MFLARLLFTTKGSQKFIWPRHISSPFGHSLMVSSFFSRSLHNSFHWTHYSPVLLAKFLHPRHSVIRNVALLSHLHTSSVLTASDDVSKTEDAPKSSSVDSKPNTDSSKSASTPASRLVLSERCRTRLKAVLDPDEILRIGVRGGGCSGFEYEFSVTKASTIKPDEDIVFEEKVVVDSESIEYMSGAQLDYEDELIRSGFRIVNNPLAEKGCSCGSSFSLKF